MKSLFRSQAAYELLERLTQEPERRFYLSELAKVLRRDVANVTRELSHLVREDLVRVIEEHGKKFYAFNRTHLLAPELTAFFRKTQQRTSDDRFTTTWLLAEDIPNIDPFFSKIWLNCFVDEFAKPGGRAYQKIAAVYRDYHLWFYYDKEDACAVGEHLVERFVRDSHFMEQVNEKIIEYSDRLRTFAAKLPETNLARFSNAELWRLYKRHDDLHTAYYQWGWIPVAADMFCENLTQRGKVILREYGVPEEKVNETLTALTQPTRASLMKIEQEGLAEIGMMVQKNPGQFRIFQELFREFKEEDAKRLGVPVHGPEYERAFEEKVRGLVGRIKPAILKALQKHYTTYFYTRFLFTEEQGVYSFEHYLKALVRLVNNDPNLAATLRAERAAFRKTLAERTTLVRRLKLSRAHARFFNAWGEFMVTKIYRRFAQLFALYKMTPIVEEIGRRLGLSLKEVKFLMIEEVEGALRVGRADREAIKARVPFSVYYADKHERFFIIGPEAEQAAKLVQKEEVAEATEIRGQCGCQGHARGIVRIVNVVEDMKKMQPGDILVSISTQPDLLPAMKKAEAFVTDQGGVTSHAAIVAREMNKPCVIGTKIATKVLKDGYEVEVDANQGIVKILKRG